MRFDRRHQSFTLTEPVDKPDAGKLQSALAALWSHTPAAPDESDGDA